MVVSEKARGVTIQSVERAASVLQVFFDEGTPCSVTEVVQRTGLAPATAHRLLSTLVKVGWLQQDPRSSRYELSERMLGSSALALANSALLRHGQHFLTQVALATGVNSFLAVQMRRGSVLLARVQGRAGSAPDFQVGKTHPIHASASGKLFLAHMAEPARAELLSRQDELRRFTSNTITDPRELERELDAIRSRGYAVDRGEMYETMRGVAVPVRKADGTIVAALCCAGWLNQLPDDFEEALVREMIPVAEEFSHAYGDFETW